MSLFLLYLDAQTRIPGAAPGLGGEATSTKDETTGTGEETRLRSQGHLEPDPSPAPFSIPRVSCPRPVPSEIKAQTFPLAHSGNLP